MIVQMTFVPRNYTGTSTDRETCKWSHLHDFSLLSAVNYHPLMWSLPPGATHQSPSHLPYFLFYIVSLCLSQCTYTGGVIALSRRERGHPQGRTNVQNRMYRVVAVKESKRKVGVGASITIIILPHLERWFIQWSERKKTEKTGDERRKKPLMAVSKSKAQLHVSTFIAFSHEHPEHPHNNQRHFSGILVSP